MLHTSTEGNIWPMGDIILSLPLLPLPRTITLTGMKVIKKHCGLSDKKPSSHCLQSKEAEWWRRVDNVRWVINMIHEDHIQPKEGDYLL